MCVAPSAAVENRPVAGRLVVLLCALVLAAPARATDGESSDSCRECGGTAYRLLKACLAGGGDETTCKAAAQQTFTACIDGCEVVEASCESRCEARAHAAKEECFENGGSKDGLARTEHDDDADDDGKPDCWEVYEDVQGECLEEECETPTPSCDEECQAEADGYFDACVDPEGMTHQSEGDGGSEAECAAAADAKRDACVAERCGAEPACPDRCAESAQENADGCLEAGVPVARCLARMATAVRHCTLEHCDESDGHDEPSCESRCEEHAQAEGARCAAAGGDAATCQSAADAAFASCVAMHCTVADKCEKRCARRGAKAERKCLRNGGTAEECAIAAADAIAECEADRCAPPPPASCPDTCEARVEALRAACQEDGGDPAACEDMASGAREECLAACATSPDATCEEVCENDAETTLGASEIGDDRALRRAHRSYRKCERRCDAPSEGGEQP